MLESVAFSNKVEASIQAQNARTQNGDQTISWQVVPKVECHVPYYKTKHNGKSNLELIIVYMFFGNDKLDAHEKFFECPETTPYLNRDKAVPTITAQGQDVALSSCSALH